MKEIGQAAATRGLWVPACSVAVTPPAEAMTTPGADCVPVTAALVEATLVADVLVDDVAAGGEERELDEEDEDLVVLGLLELPQPLSSAATSSTIATGASGGLICLQIPLVLCRGYPQARRLPVAGGAARHAKAGEVREVGGRGGACEDGLVSAATREREQASGRHPRLSAAMREGERVTPLELFFDLVFVLALTQCTALMAHEPTWQGVLKGMLVLGVLWWSWCGYAWLTSVIDPEQGSVRLAMLLAMAALLVASLSVRGAFGDAALLFACAYAVVRGAHILLFVIASREDPQLRRSVLSLAGSTAIGVGLLVIAAFAHDGLQIALWALALSLDMIGPYLFGSEGWKLVPGHFAERHGLIVIIALGESIVALGVGAGARVGAGEVAAAVLGIVVAGALWWLYFDVVALVAQRRLSKAAPGRERNEIARDSFSYLHLPMVAGIALVALGLKKGLLHVERPLPAVVTAAMLGGASLYLLAHVAFRLRNVHRLSRARLTCAAVLLVLIPISLALRPPPLLDLGALALALVALVAYETPRYAALRERLRAA